MFIACFCKEDNLLSQWRTYAAKGGGYNIGFNFDSDTKFSHDLEHPSEKSHVILRKVIYEPDDQEEIISRCIADIISEAKRAVEYWPNRGGLPVAWPSQAALESVNLLFDIIISLKNPVFAEEQEWRLVKIIDPDRLPELLKFRDMNERLGLYLDTVIYKIIKEDYIFPMSQIKFGPILDENSTKADLKLFVKNMATVTGKVKISPTEVNVESAGYVLRS